MLDVYLPGMLQEVDSWYRGIDICMTLKYQDVMDRKEEYQKLLDILHNGNTSGLIRRFELAEAPYTVVRIAGKSQQEVAKMFEDLVLSGQMIELPEAILQSLTIL